MTPNRSIVFLALPNYGSYEPQSIFTILGASRNHQLRMFAHTSSFLVDSFNTCWCEMLNATNVQYFVMLHADVHTTGPWVDTLIQEMETHDLDVISAVLPLKDGKGITSTAILQKDDIVHRLTLQEVQQLPPTFTIIDVEATLPYTGTFLVNTGMWVAKVGDWMKEFNGFRAQSQIIYDEPKGQFLTVGSAEDWDFSVWCAEKNLRVGATSVIKAGHVGKTSWPNFLPTP